MPRLRNLRVIPAREARGTAIPHDKPIVAPTETCARPDCSTTFTPDTQHHKRFCSTHCASREYDRLRWARKKPLKDPRITTTDGGERYYVVAITGWLIVTETTQSTRDPGTSYSILDSYWGDREVERFYSGPGLNSRHLERQARRRCAELNADEFAWERGEGIYATATA